MTSSWSTPEDIAAKLRRGWRDGSILRDHARDNPFEPVEVPLRGPKASEIADRLDEVRQWVAQLDSGRREDTRYCLEWTNIGGRHYGRNQIPSRAIVSTYEQVWSLLGVGADARRFGGLLESTVHRAPREWALTHPHKALAVAHEWPQLLAAHDWLDRHRASNRYLREITAPGVDTKFAERHRGVLAAMLDVPSTTAGFHSGLGLRLKPELIRMRVSPTLGKLPGVSELAVRADETPSLALEPTSALVIENEITYLSVDVPPGAVVLWGKGFEVDRIGRIPWLAGVDLTYWGDVDTHGFAILDRLRAWLPQTRSVLMDRETLLAHSDRWGIEQRPTSARLTRLTASESALYVDLVGDALGTKVRLEQERIDWSWVQERL